MRIFPAIMLIGSAAAVANSFVGRIAGRSAAMTEVDAIFARQLICKPVATPSCSESCGPGYVICAAWPNCYNPGLGQVCCSDGEYCDAGTYCADTKCCPNGQSLAQCGAKVSLSVIAPPGTSTTASSSSSKPATTSSSSSKSTSSSVGTVSSARPTNGTVTSSTLRPPTSATSTKPPAATFSGGVVESHSVAVPFCLMGALVAGLFAL